MNPFPKNTPDVFKRFKRFLVPELNSGQLLLLLRGMFLIDAKGLNKVQGRPFLVSEIEEAIEKMLNVTPLATHNQRGRATLLLGTDYSVEARDLVALVESAMSSENYALLKRPDELYIVNKAHANPRFVEDVVREVLGAVVEKYSDLPDDAFVWVHQRNEETIHKYDVEAEGWGTLGELRSEILENVSVERHTSKEEWLGLTGLVR